MSRVLQSVSAFGLASLLVAPAIGATIYNNLTPSNLIAVAARPDTAPFEIEAGDDFFDVVRDEHNCRTFWMMECLVEPRQEPLAYAGVHAGARLVKD